MKRKVPAWKREITNLDKAIFCLERKYRDDAKSVKAEDWDEITAGKERKLQMILGAQYPRENWPVGVPYLNVIARAKYHAAEKAGLEEAILKEAEEAEKKRIAEEEKKKALESEKKETAEAGKKKIEAALKKRHTMNPYFPVYHGPAPEPISYDDADAREAYIREGEYQNAQMEKQHDLLSRSLEDPTSVSFQEWQDAIIGTDALERDSTIICYVELARRRLMSEECNGWVFGRYCGGPMRFTPWRSSKQGNGTHRMNVGAKY
jgi:hypothetical protein